MAQRAENERLAVIAARHEAARVRAAEVEAYHEKQKEESRIEQAKRDEKHRIEQERRRIARPIMEEMRAGHLLFDNYCRILETNKAAQKYACWKIKDYPDNLSMLRHGPYEWPVGWYKFETCVDNEDRDQVEVTYKLPGDDTVRHFTSDDWMWYFGRHRIKPYKFKGELAGYKMYVDCVGRYFQCLNLCGDYFSFKLHKCAK